MAPARRPRCSATAAPVPSPTAFDVEVVGSGPPAILIHRQQRRLSILGMVIGVILGTIGLILGLVTSGLIGG